MAKPNLSIAVQPLVGGKATCLPVAASASDGQAHVRIVLRLDITNNEANAVTIHRIRYSFPGSPHAAFEMLGEDVYYGGELKDIPAGGTVIFSNGRIDLDPTAGENIVDHPQFVPLPMPPQVTIGLFCTGFTEPAELTLDLTAHESPVAGGAYLFPYRVSDLRRGEYFVARAWHWANGGKMGPQIFAHDIGAQGVDPVSGEWTGLLPGKDGSKNSHYRIYGKPVCAMADGVVEDVFDGMAENTTPGALPQPAPQPGSGNHVWIRHGSEVVLYAHLQPGLPAGLVQGASVQAGQVLGRVGNTGNSSVPHTHIAAHDASIGGPLRGFPFRNAWVLARNRFSPPNPQGPWVKLTGQGISKDAVAIWPAESKPTWYPPGWGEVARHGVPEAQWQVEFERIGSSGYRLVWIDAYRVNGSTFFNCIWRPSGNTTWQARHGLSGADYQTQVDLLTSNAQGYRLVHIESYWSGGMVRYAPIFVHGPGPAHRCYHGKTEAEQVALDQAWRAEGFVPVNFSVVNVGGTRRFTGLYEARNVGPVHLDYDMTPDEYQAKFSANWQAGLRLVYLNAYELGGTVRFVAIWHDLAAGGPARHHLSSADYQAKYDEFLGLGLLTRAVTGYEWSGKHQFAAFWTK